MRKLARENANSNKTKTRRFFLPIKLAFGNAHANKRRVV